MSKKAKHASARLKITSKSRPMAVTDVQDVLEEFGLARSFVRSLAMKASGGSASGMPAGWKQYDVTVRGQPTAIKAVRTAWHKGFGA